ncbi:DUF3870 domain-containing protein [Pseudalkalibacillus sp. SCS-8]|uniref:DUF3870 domain-containing protein n=1 Tax=Pseudalkalibacillus nanhaiensis TaxID=3115291 RepID=UPI0032DA6F32
MPNTIIIAGHARIPNGVSINEPHETLTVTIEVDKMYGVIIWADCTLATEHSQAFFGDMIKGLSLRDGIDLINKEIENHYYGNAQTALTAAVMDAYRQYKKPHVVR